MVNVINNQDEYKNKIIKSLRDENEQLQANMDYLAMMTSVEIEEDKTNEISEIR